MNFLGFGQSADIRIALDGEENRKWVEIKQDETKRLRCPVYYDGETVSGKVQIALKKQGQKFEHQGIRIDFLGLIEMQYDRSNTHEFISMVKELARPGELRNDISYPFEFGQVEKPHETYTGTNVRLRYVLRVIIVRRISDLVQEQELAVHTLWQFPEVNQNIRMEVGIEGCLHIEFEYNKSKYHLRDVIVGKVYFILVRVKIKHMELQILRRETTGTSPQLFNETETIAKYEIMDGAPVRGESIPIRLFLSGYELTPTMRDVQKRFSVRYYLNLVLVDEEERRYFKQQEITLYRKAERRRRPLAGTGAQAAQTQSQADHPGAGGPSSSASAIARLDASTALGPSVPMPMPIAPSSAESEYSNQVPPGIGVPRKSNAGTGASGLGSRIPVPQGNGPLGESNGVVPSEE